MAQFDTDHVLTVITQDALRDHEANRRVIEALEGFRLGNQEMVVDTILEVVLRQLAQTSHGRDLMVGLMDRFTDEARSQSLARIELAAQGACPEEIEFTLKHFPEDFTPEVMLDRPLNRHRGPTHQELMEAGAI